MADDKKPEASEASKEVSAPAPPGFEPGMNLNSDDARRMYDESGHDFDAIQEKQEPPTFADGTTADSSAPADDVRVDEAPADEPEPEPKATSRSKK